MRRSKFIYILAAAGFSAILAAGCGNKQADETTAAETTTEAETKETDETETADGDGFLAGMPNPFIDCDNADDAAKEAGFTLETPTFDDLENRTYQAVKNEMIQVFNTGEGSADDGYILVRKALKEAYTKDQGSASETASDAENSDGSDIVDISGDYNDYAVTETMDINGMTVVAKGDAADAYSVAIWNDGDYAYAMDMSEITIPAELIEAYVPDIK